MICHVSPCNGAGWIVARRKDGRLEWWPCPACGGTGVTVQYGPPKIRSHATTHARKEKIGGH